MNGVFASGSSDKYIRIWSPLDNKPMGNLEEDFPITLMIKLAKTPQDVTMIYVAQKVIRLLSLKQQKAIFLYKCDFEITAITKINNLSDDRSIIAFGTPNGRIYDFDI